ncbi:MAG: hypothetical protein ACSLE5_03110 [Porticoccaceae bacterium]
MKHHFCPAFARASLFVLILITSPLLTAETASQFAESVIRDMTGPNDGVQLGYQRHHYAGTDMGLMARGDYTPSYWKPYDQSLKSATWWTGIAPWWNVLPMQGNAATKTRVEVGTVAAIVRNKGTNTWRTIFNGPTGWAANYNASAAYYVGPANMVAGTISGYPTKLYLPPSGSNTIHGGGGLFQINAQGIDGVILCTAARLVGPDVWSAKYALWVGADWHPYPGFNVAKQTAPHGWIPAIATERFKKITTQWQSFCAAPLDIPGRNGSNSWYKNGVGVFMSTAQLRASPPPPITRLLPY